MIKRSVVLALVSLRVLMGETVAQEATIVCTSVPGQRELCAADTGAGVVLTRQFGPAECLLGRTWGYESGGIWVSDGCAGDFIVSAPVPSGSVTVADSGAAATQDDAFIADLEVYSRLRGHAAFFDGEAEVQDNASWLGLRADAGDSLKVFAAAEWAVNLIQNDRLFNPGGSTNTDFSLEAQKVDAFALRLGYVGLDMGSLGTVSLGKQKAVHYDIAGYTADRFYVFGGGVASLAYPAESDGGETGTGRADQTLQYRTRLFDRVDIGLQAQFRGTSNDEVFDGLAASARVALLPRLEAGISYTQTRYAQAFEQNVDGIDDDGEYVALGVRWESGSFEAAVVWATQNNGDLVAVANPAADDGTIPVGFDGDGLEVYGKARLGRFSVLAGLVNYQPDHDDPRIDPSFRVRYFVVGGEYRATQNSFLYVEYRANDSVDGAGVRGDDVLAAGINYNFSFNALHRP